MTGTNMLSTFSVSLRRDINAWQVVMLQCYTVTSISWLHLHQSIQIRLIYQLLGQLEAQNGPFCSICGSA